MTLISILSACLLIKQRYNYRNQYANLYLLDQEERRINEDYSKLKLESATYLSNITLQNIADQLGFVKPDETMQVIRVFNNRILCTDSIMKQKLNIICQNYQK